MKKIKQKIEKIPLEKVFIWLILILFLIFIFNTFSINTLKKDVTEKVALAEEEARPAEIELTIIDSACPNCFDINLITDNLKSKNIEITNEETLTKDQASDLIQKYSITKLPSLIVEGEIDKFDLGLEKKDNVLLFNNPEPPYYDLATNTVLGLVELTLINDQTCTECTDLSPITNQFKQIMTISNEKTLSRDQASDLISKYSITKIPTIILSKEASLYGIIIGDWDQVGTIENDGSLVVRDVNPPYIDVITNKVKGIVKLTYIVDKSCTDCYDVTNHKQILDNFGVYISGEETKDISESSSLISKYNIEKIPTIILSEQSSEYPRLTAVWKDVGTVEDDGTYIFRETQLMGVSKDLTTGEIITQTK